VPDFAVVEHVPVDSPLPRVHTLRYNFLLQQGRVREELYVIDVAAGSQRRLQVNEQLLNFDSSIFMRRVWWRPDGAELAVAIFDFPERRVDLYKADPATGEARRLFHEESPRRVYLSGELQHPPSVALLSNGDVVWYSLRDGFGHLYRIDGRTGELRNAITSGSFAVHRLLFVDERAGWLYFAAGGDTYGPEPYFAGVFRVRLDGSRLTRLTKDALDHQVGSAFIGPGTPPPATTQGFAPGGGHFVDSASTPLQPEVTALRAADGRIVAELARATVSPRVAVRYLPPQRVIVPAPAGNEALHGTLYFPSDFDPSRKYPVIDAIYNGAQVVETPRRFSETLFGTAQNLAELGFVVLVMDARGTPLRSRAFLEFAAEHPDQEASIGDHVHALRTLAATRPYLDLARVGITGVSNGGYATLRAMLAFPEFFKVGVAANGSHDLRKYMPGGGSNGVPDAPADLVELFRPRANQEIAGRLQGRLLMIIGGFDANVPIAQSLGVAQALIDAGKNFDVVVVPRMCHSMSRDRFAVRKQWDFFIRHLRDETPPGDYRMPQAARAAP
jgi:dipeptidyl-peptidase 4